MDCPVCTNPMITLELSDVEVDYCDECGGIWLDAGELEILLQSRQQARQLLASFQKITNSAEKRRKCPICLKKMQKIQVGDDEPALTIDQCRKGDGLWFDRGELPEVLKRGKLDKEHKIQKTLSEIFAQ